jgi:hypothetical protein
MGAGWRINSMSSITDARCHACEGKGIVWPPVDNYCPHDAGVCTGHCQVAERDAEIERLRADNATLREQLANKRPRPVIHARVWLQYKDRDENWQDTITWCQDRQFATDIEYVRGDQVPPPRDLVEEQKAEIATLRSDNATLREALMNIRVKYCEWYDDEESEAIDVLGWVYDEARRVLALHGEKP